MTKELNENTSFKLSAKTLIAIGIALSTLMAMWFTLKADIAEAKELPTPEVTRTEYDLKDQMIRQTIMNTQDDVTDIKETQKNMDEKLDKIQDKLYETR